MELRTTLRSNKSAQIRSCHRSSPSSCTAAWPCCEACLDHFVGKTRGNIARSTQTNGKPAVGKPTRTPHATRLPTKPVPKMKDPSGGTTGRVKPYGALGVDGRSRRIQPMGRDNRSHINKSQHLRRTFKMPADFFNPAFGAIAAKSLRSRLFRSVCGRFVRRHRRRGVIQCPAHGSVIGRRVERRRFFSRRLARNGGKRNRRRGGRRSDRGKGIGLTCSKLIVATGSTEIAGGLRQKRANIARFQRRIVLQHQRRDAADIGGGERGARRDLILFIRRRQEDVRARG